MLIGEAQIISTLFHFDNFGIAYTTDWCHKYYDHIRPIKAYQQDVFVVLSLDIEQYTIYFNLVRSGTSLDTY